MITLIVKRANGDLLWRGDASEATLTPDGTFTFKGAAQPIKPPYSIQVGDQDAEEDDGSPA